MQSYMGDARGRWEGDTLVVETTNVLEKSAYGGASDKIKITERFRPTSNKTIEWSITFDDKTTWVRPWTFGMRLTKDESHVFEYACHEGNEGLRGILSAARVAEREAGRASSVRFLPLSLGLGLALACVATRAQERPVTVITGATLIDGTTRPAVPDAVIIIDGARITHAGAAVAVPAGATVIDGHGKFVIPGLADMHHHLLSGSMRPIANRPSVLRRMLAVGVTTVFTPSIASKDFAALKTATAEDTAPYARFFGTGPSITVKEDGLGAPRAQPLPRRRQRRRRSCATGKPRACTPSRS